MFGFPTADHSIKDSFKRNFLKTIVLQLKFDETKILFKNKTAIHQMFQSVYTRLNDAPVNYEIQINRNETPIVNTSRGDSFLLRTRDGGRTLLFNPNSIDLNIVGSAYENFANILDDELAKISKIFDVYNISLVNRIAIRKINVIGLAITPGNNMGLIVNDLLNPQLGSRFNTYPEDDFINQNMNSVSYVKDSDSLILKIGYSVQPQNATLGHIISDIDRFSLAEFDKGQIINKFREMNAEVFDVFMWSLSDRSIKLLQNG